jgi:hypothetical protein
VATKIERSRKEESFRNETKLLDLGLVLVAFFALKWMLRL